MTDARTSLSEGARILTDSGTAVVIEILSDGVKLRDVVGQIKHISWQELPTIRAIDDGKPAPLAEPLRPMWDALTEHARNVALMRLEVVQEIVTGFRDGHAELAREGEPRPPFGPGFGQSISQRCEAMAEIICKEQQYDRILQRRVRDGEVKNAGINSSTIRNWVRAWTKDGLVALIDGRSTRQRKSRDLIGELFCQEAERVIAAFDGDISTVSSEEIERRVRRNLKKSGFGDVETPQRETRKFLSELMNRKGSTTRSQASRAARKISGTKHFPAIRPGQVVAIDVTRADNLVYDPFTGRSCSVEIITAIDVATRVVLALRVVPRSADGIDAGLLLYDVCRPFSLLVEGTSISEWRWVGLPEQLDCSQVRVRAGRRLVAPDFTTLQGEHLIPAVTPDAVHCDRGSIFLSQHFYSVLHDFQIDLLLSRPGTPTDNPQVERWHETIQRALQQIPGYKGRNTTQRGRRVDQEPLLTAQELQDHLRRFIALDYHRSWHTGLVLPGEPTARLCPLEMWDVMVEMTGRIDIPQQPNLIYQFLPIRWATISHAGVELSGLTYESTVLGPYREVPEGFFRPGDRAAPFFVDPHDLSRVWFRDPQSNDVEPIEWRGAHLTKAPMTDAIVSGARRRIRQRGGNNVLNHGSATRQILEEITEITASPSADLRPKLTAAVLRVEQSRIDHAEAQQAQDRARPVRQKVQRDKRDLAALRRPWPNLLAVD